MSSRVRQAPTLAPPRARLCIYMHFQPKPLLKGSLSSGGVLLKGYLHIQRELQFASELRYSEYWRNAA